MWIARILCLFPFVVYAWSFAIVTPLRLGLLRGKTERQCRLLPLFALTPIGPFCPFRSEAADELDAPVEELTVEGPQFATAFSRIKLDLDLGNTPDKDQVLEAADKLKRSVAKWEATTNTMRNSCDFQIREFAKLAEAHIAKYGESIDNVVAGLKWQADCLRAMANQDAPPPPPPGLDLGKMLAAAQNQGSSPPSMVGLSAAERITATPFSGDEPAFESPTVKEEFESLCQDHNNLIQLGAQYGKFDPVGKLYFLDEIEKIEERWDIFFARFSLMKAINPKYVRQCNEFLKSMKMDEKDYRKLLKQCHDLLRQEADREGNTIGGNGLPPDSSTKS
ncbi:hypothetical protein ACA910_011024 [Epithemia clementina (nom. ined.)]